jgi:hypothetical protein
VLDPQRPTLVWGGERRRIFQGEYYLLIYVCFARIESTKEYYHLTFLVIVSVLLLRLLIWFPWNSFLHSCLFPTILLLPQSIKRLSIMARKDVHKRRKARATMACGGALPGSLIISSCLRCRSGQHSMYSILQHIFRY